MNTSPQNEPRHYLITIGSPWSPKIAVEKLEKVENDIERIKNLLQKWNYELEFELFDKAKETIERKLREFFSAKNPINLNSSDNIIVYYSGHGIFGGNSNSHYLLTFDSENEKTAETAIKTSDLVNWFFEDANDTDPPNVLLILDVCYAGGGVTEIISQLSQTLTRTRSISKRTFGVIESCNQT